MPSKFLIVGLGNIGTEYINTRHNIGFDVVEAFVIKHGGFFKNDRLADVAELKWKGHTFICIKPTTYMNLSGKAVRYWMDKEKISIENILVIVDDLALPISKLRLRGNGSDAGHNGLKDIQLMLNTEKYPRLKFGIGSNYPKGMQVEFVIGKWFPEERTTIQKKIEKSVEIIEAYATMGLERAMNMYNNIVVE